MRIRLLSSLIILLSLSIILYSSVFVISKGCSTIFDSVETARILSLEEAKKNAIEKAKGVWMRSFTEVADGVLSEYRLEKEVEGKVKKYRIVREWNEDGMYCTEIGAFVGSGEPYYEITVLSSDTNFLPLFKRMLEMNGFRIFEEPSQFFNTVLLKCFEISKGEITVYDEKLKHAEFEIELSLILPDGSIENLNYRANGNGFDENQAIEDAFEKIGERISKDIKSSFHHSGKIFLISFLSEGDEVRLENLLSVNPNVLKFEKFKRKLGTLYRINIVGDPTAVFLRMGMEFGDEVSVIQRGGVYELSYSER